MNPSFGVRPPVWLVAVRRFELLGMVFACGICLAGCVQDASQAPVAAAAASSENIARRPGVSPAGATVAVASITGAPGGLNERYQAMLAAYAKRSDVSIADGGDAEYLVRGYLSAYPEGDAQTAVSYVLDVFDARKHRAQRVTDEVAVRGTAPDPWSLVNDDVLAAVAQKSAADLAAVMTNTPEAIAAASGPPPGHATEVVAGAPPAAPSSGQTVVAATSPALPPQAATSAEPAAPAQSPSYGMTAQR